MNFEGIIKKKESGKNELSVSDMAAASGMEEGYIRDAMECGFLNSPHYTAKFAVDGVELSSQDQAMVEKNIESIKAKRGSGFTSAKAMQEISTAKVIESARLEGRPIHFKYREKSAEEVFAQFWKSPAGKNRMTGKLRGEIANIKRGGQWFDKPQGLHAMPSNYEDILWTTTEKMAAELHVKAIMGDKGAVDRYNALRVKFPTLPALDLPELESAKDRK